MFAFDSPELCNQARITKTVPLTIECEPHPWHYAVAFRKRSDFNGPCFLRIKAKVLSGSVGIGVDCMPTGQFQSYLTIEPEHGSGPFVLPIPDPAKAGLVIIRTGAFAVSSVIEIDALDVLPANELETVDTLLHSRVNVIFDVGANKGQSTAMFVERWPSATIHAFEPHPQVSADYAARFAGNPNVHLVTACVGAEAGRANLKTYGARTGINSLLPFTADAGRWVGVIEPDGEVSVPVIRLDDYCAERKIDRIDFLKIDTQGYESRVLAGASRMLAAHAIGLIRAAAIFAAPGLLG